MVRILICEEGFLNRSQLAQLLAGVGGCDLATSAGECVECCDTAVRDGQPYDLITLDVDLQDLMDTDAQVNKPFDAERIAKKLRELGFGD